MGRSLYKVRSVCIMCTSYMFAYILKQKLHHWEWYTECEMFCLHCNIFIYNTHIWIKLVLCKSHSISLPSHFTLNRCLQSSPNAHRNGRVFRRLVQIACCYWILKRGKSSSNWNSQTNASRLWWSVCWCEYSKMLGKAVEEVKSAVRKWFQKQNIDLLKDGFQKLVQRWRKCIDVRRDLVEKWLCSFENNWCRHNSILFH